MTVKKSSMPLAHLILISVAYLGYVSAQAPIKGAEPQVSADALPRTAPVDVKDVLNTFQVKPGFHLEVAAAEPLVVDPIAMCFDENGRMFVIEMRDYSERRDEKLGRIRLLEDTDGDGAYDKSTIFAEGLPWPTALFWYDGGLFVGCTPDILYLKDTDGDGKADERKVVYTGFASGMAKLNVQGLLNNLTWGLDNRIHGATGLNGGRITSPHFSGKTVELRGKDFSFDPRNLADFGPETGGGQHGLSFDNKGRKFICHNSDHIRLVMYDDRYGSRNPFYTMPAPVASIAVDGPAAEVYRISPDEPWRVLRTKWRVSGQVSGPIEGGGRASGYFTSAAGITIYRGDAFPSEYLGDAFIADVGSNLIHRKKVRPDGVGFKAERAAGEENVEFIASRDLWFRPVQFANAPDGTLYVADMYREVIEHPWSIPESIKKHLDLNSGNDRGRIYRIAPNGFKPRKAPQLGQASAKELAGLLSHANGWHRDTASRLIYQRQTKEITPELEQIARHGKSSLGRLHALYALDGLAALETKLLGIALRDQDSAVREHAIKLCEKTFAKWNAKQQEELWSNLSRLTGDSAPRVRFQLALTAGELNRPNKISVLARLLRNDAEDNWIQAAVLNSLSTVAAEMLTQLASDSSLMGSRSGQKVLGQLAFQVGAANRKDELSQVSAFLKRDMQPGCVFLVARSLADGLQRSKATLDSILDPKPIFSKAKKLASDPATEETTRVEAVQLLGYMPFMEAEPKILPLISVQQPQAVQLAAVQSLRKFSDAAVGRDLMTQWASLTPRVRNDVMAALLERPERVLALLDALAKGQVSKNELSSTQVQFLRAHKNNEVREKASLFLGPAAKPGRQAVVDEFHPALNLNGDPQRGKAIYEQRCASCHRAGTLGFAVGPDLVTVKTTGKEKLLINILDPNREVPANYLTYLLETKGGESFLGILARETGNSVILRQAFGKEETIARASISSMKNQDVSLMPEGLETGLELQGMADLLEFIEKL